MLPPCIDSQHRSDPAAIVVVVVAEDIMQQSLSVIMSSYPNYCDHQKQEPQCSSHD